jgi:beta-glucosidase-like glycosyl hydrolase
MVVIVVVVPLFIGLTRFPKILGDEGIYVSQGWWLVSHGELGPYTYWYDHFPLGWLQVGLWQVLTGGPFTFGMSVFSGRVLMVLLAGLAGLGVFEIMKILSKRTFYAWLAVVLFAFSPLAIIFHRQVLLDNIATFWLVWSIYLLLSNPKSLKAVLFSSIFLVVGILSKEVLVVVVPAFMFGIWRFNRDEKHLKYVLLLSGVVLIFGMSLFAMLALLKGELWPSADKVSLLGTMFFQLDRGSGVPFYAGGSELRGKLDGWLIMDPLIIISGILSLFWGIGWFWRDRFKSLVLLVGLFLLSFLVRGGLVLDFYIIPLIPWLVISMAMLLEGLIGSDRRLLMTLIGAGIAGFYLVSGSYVYTFDATLNQLEALAYAKDKKDWHSMMIGDNFFFLDMVGKDRIAVDEWPIHWYTKAALDPAIRDELLRNRPEAIGMILVNSTMQQEIDGGVLPILEKAQERMILSQYYSVDQSIKGKWLLSKLPYTVEEMRIYERKQSNEQVVMMMAALSETQRLGQHILIGLDSYELTDTERDLIEKGMVAGVLIRANNVSNSLQLTQLIQAIRDVYPLTAPPVIAIVHEGGRIAPIPWIDNLAPAYWKSESEAAERGQIRARQLGQLGINMVIGPAVDRPNPNTILAKEERAVPEFRMLPAYLDSLSRGGILPIVGYYPGALRYLAESPVGERVPVVSVGEQDLIQDLEPYRMILKDFEQDVGLLVMHAYYNQLHDDLTTKSPFFIGDIVRNQWDFRGMVVIEDIARLSTSEQVLGQILGDSLAAGSDLVIINNSSIVEAVIKAFAANNSVPNIEESLARTLRIRSKWN